MRLVLLMIASLSCSFGMEAERVYYVKFLESVESNWGNDLIREVYLSKRVDGLVADSIIANIEGSEADLDLGPMSFSARMPFLVLENAIEGKDVYFYGSDFGGDIGIQSWISHDGWNWNKCMNAGDVFRIYREIMDELKDSKDDF